MGTYTTYISIYCLCGLAFNFMYDRIIDSQDNEENRFNTIERLIVLILWPFALMIFTYHFLKAAFGNNNYED